MRSRLQYGILFVLVVLVSVGVLAWSILSRGFSARDEPSAAEAFIARGFRHLAIPRKAREARNPVLSSPEVLAGAMEHFADHCAICHGNDGKGKTLIGKGLYPKPPDMSLVETQRLTDGELYYIIQNGVRLTGMPGWGNGSERDSEDSWKLVHFIRHLSQLTLEERKAMEKMNPKSPDELREEQEEERFLRGEDSHEAIPEHHHH